ncbi:hypothetical protein KAH43_01410, partial [Candidatus Bipolaricaulota bacterium]|nr:hypothetical protein [Candidatus Bipolaricaulota bacterium]
LGLNSGVLAANTLALIFDAAALVADATPDPVVGVGVGIIVVAVTGVTIPTSDIMATIIGGARIALQTYTLIATTDLDGDGLPGIIEMVTHTADDTFDSDGDGLGDGYEVTVAGGFYGPHTASNAYEFGDTACPNPNIEDSDKDGIIDGDEGFYNTSMCDPDTDDDTLTDYQEVATWSLGDIRDHADPLLQDTDGDGIRDDIEYASSSCTYVNEADSDDDGLDDGTEDWNADGTHGTTFAGTGDQALTSWETNPCDFDTDGDGLSDGEEFQLLGGLYQDPDTWKGTGLTPFVLVSAAGPSGTVSTIPALDTDSDDDGLTDYEEVNVYQTNPLDWDTDNDTVSDGVEIATWDSVIAARLGLTASSDSRDYANPREADTDGDGLTDNFEITYGCNCGTGTDGYVNDDDSDDDGLQDGREYELFGTGADVAAANGNDGELEPDGADTVCCLCDPDSDGDGLSDGEEVFSGTDPLDWDSDDDGLSDKEELQVYFTDPNDEDTDDDGAKGILITRPASIVLDGFTGDYGNILLESDGEEALSRTGVTPFGFLGDQSDPLSKDTDGDGIQDDIEFPPGCNCSGEPGSSEDGFVNDSDSDDDGIQDGSDTSPDVAASNGNDGELDDDGICSLCDPDSDGDGLSDGEELHIGTDPLDWDSDNDGLSDREELQIYFTDPNDPDTDDDQADGNIEARDPTTAPILIGHSGTGAIAALSDCEEALSGTPHPPFGNPLDETDPLQVDTDGDGLSDAIEFRVGCSCEATPGPGCTPFAPIVVYDPLTDGYANSFDSDGDGLRDDLDIAVDVAGSDGNNGELNDDSTHSICDPDSDGDGLSDGEELHIGTDPLDWDSDNDGLSDREELQIYFTDPNNDDSDG